MRSILILVMLTVSSVINAQAKDDTTYVKTLNYEGIIFGKNYPLNITYENNEYRNKTRWSPTHEDIKQAELLIANYVTNYARKKGMVNQSNSPIIHLNFCNYLRQYIGEINEKGERIIYINYFWKEMVELFPNWKVNEISVLDGKSYFWYIKVNLKRKKCFDFYVNG